MNNIERHQKILDEIHDTYIKKNNDYGDSFAQVHREIGIQADLGQICHKWNRLKSLGLGNEQLVKGESIIDTLTDLANYCIMTRMSLEEDIEKEKEMLSYTE